MFLVPRGHLGRWSWARNRLRDPLAALVQQRRLPAPPDSPLARERQWILAREIMRIAHKPHGTAIPLADLRQALAPMIDKAQRPVRSTWAAGGPRVDSDDVHWICAQLDRETGDLLVPPWPAPDRPDPAAPWTWQLYTPELTRAILTEVLRAAVTGYQGLVEENFAGFGWALGLNSVLPVRVEGTVIMPSDDAAGQHSCLQYELKPSRQEVSHVDVDLDLVTRPGDWQPAPASASDADRAMSPFYIPALHNPPLPTGQTRPATNLACEWLSADLYALGWLSHALTFHDLQLPVGPRDVSAGGQPFCRARRPASAPRSAAACAPT
jgi:hypothetical protein